MAKKKNEIIENNIDAALDDIVSDRFGRYSKYIIQERALPDARDGLKPVQRRILYSMYIDGNTVEKPHRKSAKTVGSVMGSFHPHGDSSIYEAMVRMSQDWKVNLPLVDMHGNNGSIDNDPPAAMRYTEARLSQNAAFLLDDIDKETVPMTNNYDDTALEPTVLPLRYPLLLVNGSTGIASGYATNIAPHNLNEVVRASIYRLHHPECSLGELMEFIKGPDFPTGGIVQGKKNIEEIFSTGKGKVILRSRCSIEETRTNTQIIVTEIPYEVVKSDLVKAISNLYLAKDIEGITDIRDESGRNGLRIVIDLKKDANAKAILNYLYKNTDLQINYSYNMIAIVDHRPKLMSLMDALDAFLDHRRQTVLNRSVYLLNKKKARLHIVQGLIKAVSILDSVIEIIRRSEDKKDAKEKLCEAFLFTDEQAEAIVNLRLYRLSNTDITQLKMEFAELTKDISYLESLINSKEVMDSLLTKELEEVNKTIVTPRKTT
ncbi:MAG: DNA topoisomerase 4 subunit A, partial [Erysipelotrichaceae bacterium]|nr:DNA topoisomerase 4 subunit A [Erysipelotrichaceae bacterium]